MKKYWVALLLTISCFETPASGASFEITILPTDGSRICLASTVTLFDEEGNSYRPTQTDCSVFTISLAPGRSLVRVESTFRERPFELSVSPLAE